MTDEVLTQEQQRVEVWLEEGVSSFSALVELVLVAVDHARFRLSAMANEKSANACGRKDVIVIEQSDPFPLTRERALFDAAEM